MVPQSRHSSVHTENLADILQQIDSPFLNTVELFFVLGPDSQLRRMNWRQLERALLALHFFGMQKVHVHFDIVLGVEQKCLPETIEKMTCEAMPDLYRRGVLRVHAAEADKAENKGGHLVLSNLIC